MPLYFQKGWPAADLTYPVTTIPTDPGTSTLVSPRVGNAHSLPAPTFPGDAGFEAELNEIIELRMNVLAGNWPSDFLWTHRRHDAFDPDTLPQPLLDAGLVTTDPEGCAHVVHMDKPYDMAAYVSTWLVTNQSVALKETAHDPFLETIDMLDLSAVKGRICQNLGKAFEAKYYYGRPRPEEAVTAGYGAIDPGDALTHYPEGCPNHPAYPAGHGAAASAVKVFIEMYNLSTAQINVVKDCAYLWSMFRSFAGVHYANDNLAGLEIGGM